MTEDMTCNACLHDRHAVSCPAEGCLCGSFPASVGAEHAWIRLQPGDRIEAIYRDGRGNLIERAGVAERPYPGGMAHIVRLADGRRLPLSRPTESLKVFPA